MSPSPAPRRPASMPRISTLASGTKAWKVPIEFELYTIKEIPRSEAIATLIDSRYRGLDELWGRAPDALIVTGTEPAPGKD